MIKDILAENTEKYRYWLPRQFGKNPGNFINFVLLNPSTANQIKDDPTTKALAKITNNLHYDGFWVTNLFALRATKPSDLKKSREPIGPENNQILI